MDRRKFISTLGLGAATAALAGCGQQDCADTGVSAGGKTYTWKLVTTWPKNYPGLGTTPERFAELVEKMSAGRIRIKVYGAGEIVPAFEVFDAVSQGSAQMGHGAAYYWKGKHPATPFFTAVPFGLTAQEMNGWLHHGGGQALYDELYQQFNLKPFAGGSTGVQMAGWFNREINTLEDLKGLKMRIPGLGGEVLERLGGTPVQLPGGELFTALQTGTIDATEWVGPYNDLTFGFHKIARYYYYPGWHEPGAMLEFIINREVWESLPEDLQAIVSAAARAMNQDMLDEYTARNNAALKQLVNEHNVQLRQLPEPVMRALKKASDDVVSELVAGNEQARRVYESYKAFEKDVVAYHRISEQAYLNLRTSVMD
ncbi:MAG: TRAP transporter substrate-binding protein [Alcanivoracaceae bacterium]|nr:TRAP transporter substrate-binding protein [Alcanivoracaceae bacterium]